MFHIINGSENMQMHISMNMTPDIQERFTTFNENNLDNSSVEDILSSFNDIIYTETMKNTGAVSLELLDCLVKEIEVQQAIKSMKLNKQPIKDGIRTEMISSASFRLCQPITKLLNFIWNTEQVPSSWSDGLICPIHKKITGELHY